MFQAGKGSLCSWEEPCQLELLIAGPCGRSGMPRGSAGVPCRRYERNPRTENKSSLAWLRRGAVGQHCRDWMLESKWDNCFHIHDGGYPRKERECTCEREGEKISVGQTEELELLRTVGGNVEWSASVDNSVVASQKLKRRIVYGSPVPRLGGTYTQNN